MESSAPCSPPERVSSSKPDLARGLDLKALRGASKARRQFFGDADAHALSYWSNATLGELGEAANIIKKIERGDFPLDFKREDLAKEFADTLIYLDIMCEEAGINLSQAVVDKFNEVSDLVNAPIRLERDHWIEKIT